MKMHPLKSFRKNHLPPLSLEQLAVQVDSTKAMLSRIESRTRYPSLDLAAKLSKCTGIPIEKFARSAAQ